MPESGWSPESPEKADEEIEDFVEFLRDTLIPDLMESGTTATAEDFIKAADIIDYLQGKS